MNVNSAHKSNWAIAEVVFGAPFLMGIAIHFIVPMSFAGILRQALVPTGIVLIIIGIGFVVLARRVLARYYDDLRIHVLDITPSCQPTDRPNHL